MESVGKFISNSFDEYCATLGINVEHPVAHVHTQNELAKSLINRIQIIARTLLIRCKLTSEAWSRALSHASTVI